MLKSSQMLVGHFVGIALGDNLEFDTALTLEEGPNALHLEATDDVGNTRKLTVTVSLDTAPPFRVDFSCLSVVELSEVRVRVSVGSRCAEPGSVAWITNLRTGEAISTAVGADGSLAAEIDARSGDTLAIRLVDGAGNMGAATQLRALFTPPAPAAQIPEGSFGYSYRDLVPEDATIASYAANRFSLVTGLVLDEAGAPLPGVAIGIHGHPEYGTAGTDREGRFSLPVEGGGTLTVVYRKEGRLTSHRKVDTAWSEIALAEPPRMLPVDSRSTTFSLDGNPGTLIVHRSTEVSDSSGVRSAALVISGDTRAFSVDAAGGVIEELGTLTIRATEYTTADSMPARLPPTSAYTYCVELMADGVERVRFDRPALLWVDNFIGFDVGTIVPVGYYDRDKAVWVPEPNGRVVKLLDTDSDGRVDAIDSDGDGLPDDLNASGSFTDEAAGLDDSSIYRPGATFWRVAITHFSPHDLNWARAIVAQYMPMVLHLAEDAIAPNPAYDPLNSSETPDCEECRDEDSGTVIASSVRHKSRIFDEDIPIPGTGLSLRYASNRVSGHAQTVKISASGHSLPAGLKRIVVKMDVAGRSFERVLEPLPDQVVDLEWDGYDHLGRQTGSSTCRVSIGFVYDGVYTIPSPDLAQAFAMVGIDLSALVAGLTREEITLWKRFSMFIGPMRGKSLYSLAEGWTISDHHQLDPVHSILHKGDGATLKDSLTHSRSRMVSYSSGIFTVAGGGAGGDGVPASHASLYYPAGLAFDDKGSLYIAESCKIRKVDEEGIITTIAGSESCGFSGDGGPAAQASLSGPSSIALDSSGSLYIADAGSYRVRKVDPGGVITTVAGSGGCWIDGSYGGYYAGCFEGDNGPATDAKLSAAAICLDTDGNLYIADSDSRRVRKVDAAGIITTVAGNGSWGFSGDGGPAVEARLTNPSGLAVDSQGSLYISDSRSCRVRRVDPTGAITTYAGNGDCGLSGDGGPAVEASLNQPAELSIDSDGNLLIADVVNGRIRMVDRRGIITTVAGSQLGSFEGDGGVPTRARLMYPSAAAQSPKGTILIADSGNHRVREIRPRSPFVTLKRTGATVYAEDSGLGYVLSPLGLHEQTVELDTGAMLQRFSYDAGNRLASISDRFGNTTLIARDGGGAPTAIVSPDGLTTILTVDVSNHLTRITYPDASAHIFDYALGGLLVAKTEPSGSTYRHRFDARGKLTEITDEEGGQWTYERTNLGDGTLHGEITTAEGNRTVYEDRVDPTGLYSSALTDATGARAVFTRSPDGLLATKQLPCISTLSSEYALDPELGLPYLKKLTLVLPWRMQNVTVYDRIYEDTDSDTIPDRITRSSTVNGNTTSLVDEVVSSRKTLTYPSGRKVTVHYDPVSLLITRIERGGLQPTDYEHDARGRLIRVRSAERLATLTYDERGSLSSLTDSLGHTTAYGYDALGRPALVERPDGASLGFSYDANGNMTLIVTPSQASHAFGCNRVNRNTSYDTPISGSYTYTYDRDRRLVRVSFPSGKEIRNFHERGRLSRIETPEGSSELSYDCASRPTSITRGAEEIHYGYEGAFLTSYHTKGTLEKSLLLHYDADMRLSWLFHADEFTVYAYDSDGLLVNAGEFSITRDEQSGLAKGVGGWNMGLARGLSLHGEINSESFYVAGGTHSSSWSVVRDEAGRITSKIETDEGVTTQYAYSYDALGRLLTVMRDGAVVEEYQYGPNGGRIFERSLARGIGSRSMTYSDEDHLLTAGDTSYEYDADGFLAARSRGSEQIRYQYSSMGELLSVELADGTLIEYTYDPLGRRIARKLNGTITEKYFWQGMTRLLAVYDGSDNLTMRFRYADSRMPLAMTKDGTTYCLSYDQVGSLRLISDSAGTIVKRIDYDSFGNILQDTNPSFQVPFGLAGGLFDPATGLVRFGVRDYDPDVGRWTAKDPILFAGGDTNLFGYCLNDPVNRVDPFGLEVIYRNGVTPPNQGVLDLLDRIDKLNGDKDVTVICGKRTEERNKQVGGRPHSRHLTGDAADIIVPGQTSAKTAKQAAQAGAGGISTYDAGHGGFTHVDDRSVEWNGHNSETLRTKPEWRVPALEWP